MMRASLVRAVLAATGVVSLLVACATPERAGDTADAPRDARTLVLAFTSPVPSFDLSDGNRWGTYHLLYQVLDGLTGVEDEGAVAPRLAARWETTDAVRWTFHLRQGVVFHDGTPFTAARVRDAWLAGARAARRSGRAFGTLELLAGMPPRTARTVDSLPGLTIVDDTTLVLAMSVPVPTLPAALAGFDYAVPAPASRPDRPIGTGAWRHLRGDPGDSLVVLGRHARFWGTAPGFDTLHLVALGDDFDTRALLRAGRIDWTGDIGDDEAVMLAADRAVSYRAAWPYALSYIDVDPDHPVLRDLAVRRALVVAMSREMLAAGHGSQRYAAARRLLTPALLGGDTSTVGSWPTLPEARALLARAWRGQRPLRFYMPPEDLLSVEDTTTGDRAAIVRFWRSAGVPVVFVRGDSSGVTYDPILHGVADARFYRSIGTSLSPRTLVGLLAHSTVPNARVAMRAPPSERDTVLRRLVSAVATAADSAAEARLVRAIERRLLETVPRLPLFWEPTPVACSARLSRCPGALTPRFDGVTRR